MMTLVMMK
jgi:hypothetical protein